MSTLLQSLKANGLTKTPTVTLSQAAKLISRPWQSIRKAERAGIISRNEDGSYDTQTIWDNRKKF